MSHIARFVLGVVAIAALILGACASPGSRPAANIGDPSFLPKAPPPGRARLYLFRPEIPEGRSQESPLVVIDGKPTFALDLLSYSDQELAAGEHVISIRPGPNESEKWAGEHRFTMAAGGTYFMAIWEDTKYAQTYDVYTLPLHGVPIPIPLPSRGKEHRVADGVRFEEASQDDALFYLRQRRPAAPLRDRGAE